MTAVELDVFGLAESGLISIPRREIDAELHAVTGSGLGDFFDDVAFTFAIGTAGNGVIGRFGRPEAEAIVMFAGEYDALAARGVQGFADGIGIEVGRVEDGGIFIAVAPLAIGKSVDGEVQEIVVLEGAPGQLASGRKSSIRGEWRSGGEQRARCGRLQPFAPGEL